MPGQRNATNGHAHGNPDRRRRLGYQHPRCRPPFRGGVARPHPAYLARGQGVPPCHDPQQSHRGEPLRIHHTDRRRPDPATQLHPGSHDLRTTGLLRHRVAGHHHRNAHPQGAQRGDHLAHATDAGRAQQQQRHPHPTHGIPLPDAGPHPLRQRLQHGLLAQRPDPRQRLRRIVLRLGTRRFRTGDPPRQQRRAPAVHEVSRRGLPPPPRQMRAQQPLGQRGTLPANHP